MFSFLNQLFGQDTHDKGFKKATRIIKKMIRKKQLPGLAITVIKDGAQVWSKGFGYADIKAKVPIHPARTIFRIGSVSKPIAAIGLLRMVEEGAIALDSSIYAYLPYFPKKAYDISIKQLGGHLSGIRNYKGNEFKNKRPLSIREGVALFENDPLLFEPGTAYAYTSYNWNLISLAMQEISGVSFERLIQERVLTPFNMQLTVADRQQDVANKAVFYKKVGRKRFKPVTEVHNYFKLAGGGYLSTSEDVARFGKEVLDVIKVDKARLIPFITSQQIGEELTYYGIGFQVSYDHRGRPYYGHVGNGLGGYGIFYIYPEENLVLSVLMNCSNPQENDQFSLLIDSVFDTLNTD